MHEYLKVPASPIGEVRSEEIKATVAEIIRGVRYGGLEAVRRFSIEFDHWSPPSFRVSDEEIRAAELNVSDGLKEHIAFLQEQVRGFAIRQKRTLVDFEEETLPGVRLGQKQIPINSVGSYSPGGRYPLIASSVMTIVVPKVAGTGRVVAFAPPREGKGIYGPQLYTMASSGADEIWSIGGVQALAAAAYGIEGLDPVDMIVGAGNAYVAEAKRQLFGKVGIDLLAGPTDILVIADESADPRLVAADLLGQAEHGFNSPSTLLTTSRKVAEATIREVNNWLNGDWPTKEVAGRAWHDLGSVILCGSDAALVMVADALAPEHLEVQTTDPSWFLQRLTNYGSLFLGAHATVAFSDKAIGTNHVLPTGGAARYTGGLWVGKFLKTVTYQTVTESGAQTISRHAAAISEAEMMMGHALTCRLRLQSWEDPALVQCQI
jgi:sulfopropanediol 3-dehydrogenase